MLRPWVGCDSSVAALDALGYVVLRNLEVGLAVEVGSEDEGDAVYIGAAEQHLLIGPPPFLFFAKAP